MRCVLRRFFGGATGFVGGRGGTPMGVTGLVRPIRGSWPFAKLLRLSGRLLPGPAATVVCVLTPLGRRSRLLPRFNPDGHLARADGNWI